MNGEKMNTGQKALQINLDAKKYGTFAEIGAGQEVARWFFHVGKASGTVAKTISAYDMAVSDAIYGPGRPLREPQAPAVHAGSSNTTCCSSGSTTRAATNARFSFLPTPSPRKRDEGGRLAGRQIPGATPRSEPVHNHHPCADARQGKSAPAGGARHHWRESHPWRVLSMHRTRRN